MTITNMIPAGPRARQRQAALLLSFVTVRADLPAVDGQVPSTARPAPRTDSGLLRCTQSRIERTGTGYRGRPPLCTFSIDNGSAVPALFTAIDAINQTNVCAPACGHGCGAPMSAIPMSVGMNAVCAGASGMARTAYERCDPLHVPTGSVAAKTSLEPATVMAKINGVVDRRSELRL